MLELHTSRHQERLPKAQIQFYCTGCHAFRRVEVIRAEIPIKKGEMELPLMSRLTRAVPCGHSSEQVYVSNKKNINRFGKSGSY